MRSHRIFILLSSLLAIFCLTASCTYAVQLDKIKLPPGFRISLYSDKVPGARSMTLGEKGTLFVGTKETGKVYALLDPDHTGKAKQVITIAHGLNQPNGVAFKNGSLYVAEISRVIRYDNIEDRLKNPPEPVVVYDKYPNNDWHGWKFIRFGPDGKLYIPIGMPCNTCEVGDPFGTITRINPDGTGFEIYERG